MEATPGLSSVLVEELTVEEQYRAENQRRASVRADKRYLSADCQIMPVSRGCTTRRMSYLVNSTIRNLQKFDKMKTNAEMALATVFTSLPDRQSFLEILFRVYGNSVR